MNEKAGIMHEINLKLSVIYLMMFLWGLSFSQAPASPLRDRVLNDISIRQEEHYIMIKVGFNFPVQYLRHYPLDHAKEINIQLAPIAADTEDPGGQNNRESMSAPNTNPAGLIRVQYAAENRLKPTLIVTLKKAGNFQVKQGDDFRSLVILLTLNKEDKKNNTAKKKGKDITSPQDQGGLSLQNTNELLGNAEKMMAKKKFMRAILIYTKLLDSTDTQVSEFAQFQLATAREYKGHLAHARAEYKIYVKTYPDGQYVVQATERLNDLLSDHPVGPGSSEDIPGKTRNQWEHDYFGSLSVYYDRDESFYQEEEDAENLSSLMTGFDVTWRSRNNQYKTETVVIGTYDLSFLDDDDNQTRFNRLYIDVENTPGTISSRLGRQSSSKGGVLTRFDGGRFGYQLNRKVRMNAVAGFPVNLTYDGLEKDTYFYGINFDLGRFADHWNLNTHFINQLSDDIEDRRAVGGEVRYVGQKVSLYSLLDYDILFDEVSVFIFTGNYLLPNDKTRINFMADFRGIPILSSSNALIGQTSPSLEALEESIGEDELRRLANDRTLDSSFVTLGISQPLSDHIQIAGDISWSKISGAPASGDLEEIESTGDDFFYSLQFVGSGMIKKGELSSIGVRYGDTKQRDSYTVTFNTRYPLYDNVGVTPRMQIDYRKNKIQTGEQWRFIPGLRLEYNVGKIWKIEMDGEYRFADRQLEGVADGERGYAISFGFRRDFYSF